jgi:hypothetical protein
VLSARLVDERLGEHPGGGGWTRVRTWSASRWPRSVGNINQLVQIRIDIEVRVERQGMILMQSARFPVEPPGKVLKWGRWTGVRTLSVSKCPGSIIDQILANTPSKKESRDSGAECPVH